MSPGSTGFPLCSSQLYTAVGVSEAGLSVRSSEAMQTNMWASAKVVIELGLGSGVVHFQNFYLGDICLVYLYKNSTW